MIIYFKLKLNVLKQAQQQPLSDVTPTRVCVLVCALAHSCVHVRARVCARVCARALMLSRARVCVSCASVIY